MAKLGDGHLTNILFELLATVFSSNLHSCPFNNIYRTSVWVSGLSQCLATGSLCKGKRSMYSSLNHSSGKEKKKKEGIFLHCWIYICPWGTDIHVPAVELSAETS